MALDIAWTNATGADIVISVGTDLQRLSPAQGSNGTQTVTFSLPSDGRQEGTLYAYYEDTECGYVSNNLNLPIPCDASCVPSPPDYAYWADGLSTQTGTLDGVNFFYTSTSANPQYNSSNMNVGMVGSNQGGGPAIGNDPSSGTAQCLSFYTDCVQPTSLTIDFEEPIVNFSAPLFGDGTNGDWEISINGEPFDISIWNRHSRAYLNPSETRYRYEWPGTTPLNAWLTHIDPSTPVYSVTLTFYPESAGAPNGCPYEVFLYGNRASTCNTTQAFNDFNNTPQDTPVSGNVLTNDEDQEEDLQAVTLLPSVEPN